MNEKEKIKSLAYFFIVKRSTKGKVLCGQATETSYFQVDVELII